MGPDPFHLKSRVRFFGLSNPRLGLEHGALRFNIEEIVLKESAGESPKDIGAVNLRRTSEPAFGKATSP
jgi:hypothetical protein